jgi:hypothetical protein
MPRKNSNARIPARSRRSSAAAEPPRTTTIATTTTRTVAEDKLWDTLRANPGATTAELALTAGIGKSTAAKFLAAWAAEGSVERTPNASGGRRTADRWTIPTTAEAPAGGQPPSDTVDETADTGEAIMESSGDNEDPSSTAATEAAATTDKASRLGKGALRGMVEDYLRANPGKEFSPNAIGKALGRSSGAVFNALVKLVGDGYAVQTQDKPKRFALKPEN